MGCKPTGLTVYVGSTPTSCTRNLRVGVRFPTWNGCIMGTGYDAGGGVAILHPCRRGAMVARLTFNQRVRGSSPLGGTTSGSSLTG